MRVVHRGVRREVVHRGVGDGGARVVRPGVESVTGCILVERGVVQRRVVQRGVETRLDVGSAVGPGVGTGFGRTRSSP